MKIICLRPSGRTTPLHGNQQGSMLIGLIVTMTILAVAAAGMLALITTSTQSGYAANRHAAAYYMAESGGRYAIPQIEANRGQAAAALDGNTYTVSGTQQFTLAVDISSSNFTILTATGVVSPGEWCEARTSISYQIPTGGSGYFPYTLFAGSDDPCAIDFSGGATVKGKIGANGSVCIPFWLRDRLELDEDPAEYANLHLDDPPDPPTYAAPDQNVDLHGLTWADSPVNISAGSYDCDHDEINMNVNVTVNLNGDVTLVADIFEISSSADMNINGNAIFDVTEMTFGGNSDFNITGDVVFIVDKLTFTGAGRINIAEGSSLTVYVDEKVTFGGSPKFNTSPDQLTFYGSDNVDTIHFTGGTKFQGTVYAPDSLIRFDGGCNITGTFVGDKIIATGGGKAFYPDVPTGEIIEYFEQH